ncbi:MAG: DUF3307 domain-containing protein [Ignavibacterium sp.]
MDSLQIKILVPLIAAHFLGDFILQTDQDVKEKNKTLTFVKHLFIITILSYLLLGLFDNYLIAVFILVTHTIIDIIKLKIKKDNIWIFLTDQSAHIFVLIIISINAKFFIDKNPEFFWEIYFGKNYYLVLALFTSIVILTKFSGILIGYIIKPLQAKIFKAGEGLNNNLPQTGKLIGYLERFIILISILMDVPAIIGFLITAKSILRYAEIKSENDKLFVEYILIGTLFSFALGISLSYLTYKSIEALKIML